MAKLAESPKHNGTDRVMGDEYTHPAFGQIVVTEWHSGGSHRMFGSDLGHRSGITIRVNSAVLHRGLSHDTIHGKNLPLIELTMSKSQWARFVASTGNGSGTPVTLVYERNGDLEECPAIADPRDSKKEVFAAEMAQGVRRALTKMSDLVSRFERALAGSTSKKELREIHHDLKCTVQNLAPNVEFVSKTFSKQVETMTDDAKIEMEAFVDGLARQIGYKGLKDYAPDLLATSTDEEDDG